MEYLLFFLISIAITIFCFWNLHKNSIIKIGELKTLLKKSDSETSNGEKVYFALTIAACLIISYVVQVFIYKNTEILSFAKLCILYAIVVSAALVDYKLKIIPNYLVLIGLGARVVIYILDIFLSSNLTQIIISDLIGLALGFGIFAVVSIITKQALGFGDAKLFAVVGLTLGSFGTYSVMFTSVLVSAVISIFLLIFKKRGRKDSIPFGPCMYIGYILTLLLGSY